ncbi:TPA: carbapenam-3-carboxylate synthase domain-containing protein [Providencia rettgeri]
MNWNVLFQKNSIIIKTESEDYIAYLTGDIYNLPLLQSTLGEIEENIWTLNSADVLCLLSEKLGGSVISFAKGDFCLFVEHIKGVLEVITESQSLNLISICLSFSLVNKLHNFFTLDLFLWRKSFYDAHQ